MNIVQGLKAIASARRLQILVWLGNPSQHFPAQRGVDFSTDGVPGKAIVRKLRVRQPSLVPHMQILLASGLVVARRKGRNIVYKRDERRIQQLKDEMVAAF